MNIFGSNLEGTEWEAKYEAIKIGAENQVYWRLDKLHSNRRNFTHIFICANLRTNFNI